MVVHQPKAEALRLVAEAVKRVYPDVAIPVEELADTLSYPPEIRLGHVAVPCHRFAKPLRQSPKKIAETIAEDLNTQLSGDFFSKTEAVNGFLNFFCDFSQFSEGLFEATFHRSLLQGGKLPAAQQEKMVVEYSQPNTHKVIHVGHLRNTVYGDAVSNLLDYLGHQVVRATYPGDMGAHIAKCLWYLRTHEPRENWPTERRADWLGRVYARADQEIRSFDDAAAEKAKQEIGKVLQGLEEESGDYWDLYQETREWSLDQMRTIYGWLGVHFDQWYFESECDRPSRIFVMEKFQEGVFVKSEGAIGLDLGEELGFALLLKTDGTGLYLTKDLDLIRKKFEDPQVKRSIYVVDSRQKRHFQQLFKIAEILGFPQAKDSLHLSYDSVVDEEGKAFSSRALNVVTFEELRDRLRETVTDGPLSKYAKEWPAEELATTADQIVRAALKYGFLKIDPNRVSRFILEDWIRVEGDTGPYLLYTAARCQAILRKVGEPIKETSLILSNPVEEEILTHLLKFTEACTNAAKEFRPNILCEFIFDLCKLFNRFYTDCPIGRLEDESLKQSRLMIVKSVFEHLRAGLELLGIETPKRL